MHDTMKLDIKKASLSLQIINKTIPEFRSLDSSHKESRDRSGSRHNVSPGGASRKADPVGSISGVEESLSGLAKKLGGCDRELQMM